MAAPVLVAQDFLAALQALLPRGRVWPRDVDALMTRVLLSLSPAWQRSADRGRDLLGEARVDTALELLPEWEETLGLPDPCVGDIPLIAVRRAQAVARFTNNGGQSVPYFIAFAAALGYTITITEYSPSHFGAPFGLFSGTDWASVWQVNGPTFTVSRFQFGVSGFGEPFATWGNLLLQCELDRIKPAHTLVQFALSG